MRNMLTDSLAGQRASYGILGQRLSPADPDGVTNARLPVDLLPLSAAHLGMII
jgi:hypothetical protein